MINRIAIDVSSMKASVLSVRYNISAPVSVCLFSSSYEPVNSYREFIKEAKLCTQYFEMTLISQR